jgi:hypothetical protein
VAAQHPRLAHDAVVQQVAREDPIVGEDRDPFERDRLKALRTVSSSGIVDAATAAPPSPSPRRTSARRSRSKAATWALSALPSAMTMRAPAAIATNPPDR